MSKLKFWRHYYGILDWQWGVLCGAHCFMITCYSDIWGLGPVVYVDWPRVDLCLHLGPIEIDVRINDGWEGE